MEYGPWQCVLEPGAWQSLVKTSEICLAPHFCSIHSQHALVSIIGLFYPLIKTKHSPLIFKYPKTSPNKITLYHPFSISKLEPFLLLFFLGVITLLSLKVWGNDTPPQTWREKTLSPLTFNWPNFVKLILKMLCTNLLFTSW